MIQDLYVDGGSFASGWGQGLEHHLFKTPTDPKSWVDYFADSVNCDNLWNHSLVAKPLDMQFYDIQQFCKQYFDAFKTFDTLFVVLEFTFISYKSFTPVKAVEGDFKNENIYPIIYNKAIDMETANFSIQYIRKSNDYLKPQEPIFSKVNPEDFDVNYKKSIDESAAKWLYNSNKDPYAHMIYAYNKIRQIKNFLKIHNIPFVMYSAGVSDNSPNKERLDFSLRTLQKDKRLVPLSAFTGLQLSKKYSIEEYQGHPDRHGHMKIASALYDWVIKHDLTKKPDSGIITV
jgi:hypothetical protein